MPAPGGPRNFFLNERQELPTFAKEGFGRTAEYETHDWPDRIAVLAQTFDDALGRQQTLIDPVAKEHYFVAAAPAVGLAKRSSAERWKKTGGRVPVAPLFGGEESRLFSKLGLDLVPPLSGGRALVHVSAAGAARVHTALAQLAHAPAREQSRWVNLGKFEPITWTDRADAEWVDALEPARPVDAMIRFQPLLTRVEVQQALAALNGLLAPAGGRLLRADRTFAGRYWCTALLTSPLIRRVASEFTSVQSVHEPLLLAVAGPTTTRFGAPLPAQPPAAIQSAEDIQRMPSVAVLDTGIAENHPCLAPYRRNGYRPPELDDRLSPLGGHGTRVASRIVFGEVLNAQAPPAVGSCRVVDAVVSRSEQGIDFEFVTPALEALIGTEREVRVFNLSFDAAPLDTHPPVKRQELLLKLQDLDNFAFERDVLLVFAAGNSPLGLQPDEAYPRHINDNRWSLGVTARSFNGAVCGGYVAVPVPGAVVARADHPSPFTRAGRGLNDSPVPGFSATAGDWAQGYNPGFGLGVNVCQVDGTWEDHAGTSYAAPLVAREAAFAFQELERHCPQNARPFAATVRAWLHLVARRPHLRGAFEHLAERTLGRGFPSAARLRSPAPESAVFIWQTILPGPAQVARVQLPVPLQWLRQAKKPRLRVVAAWNTPVNAALTDSWGARKVHVRVRPSGGTKALAGGGSSDGAYPIFDRHFDIGQSKLDEGEFKASEDPWLVEVEYEQVGAYALGRVTSDAQRVGLVVELLDEAEAPVAPQAFVQALPIAAQLDRLSLPDLPLHIPIPAR